MTPRARDGLISEPIAEELVIYNPADNTAHCLHPLAARVFAAADGTQSVEQLAELTGSSEQQIAEVLEQLQAKQLLDTQEAGLGVARRQAIKHIAKIGAVAGSVPLIVSAFIDTPLAAASTPKTAQCGTCTTSATCATGLSCQSGLCIPGTCGLNTTSCTTNSSCRNGIITGTCQGTCGSYYLCCT
jgi:hypothetical protein